MQVEDYVRTARKRKASQPLVGFVAKKPALTLAQTQEVQRQVKKQIEREKDFKQITFDTGGTTVSASGTLHNLCTSLARGDNGVNNFEGNSIQVKSIHLRCQVAVADTSNLMRTILFQWFDDTVPTPSSILASTMLGTIEAPFSWRNWSNKKLFKILKDDRTQVQALAQQTGGNGFVVTYDIFVKGTKIRKTFFDTTGTNFQKGGLYLLVVSDSTAIAHPGFIAAGELIFTD